MSEWLIHDGKTILNAIIADSQKIAEEVSGMSAMIAENDEWIGWIKVEDSWVPPKPFASWQWDGNEWIAPIEKPSENLSWKWDENNHIWVEE